MAKAIRKAARALCADKRAENGDEGTAFVRVLVDGRTVPDLEAPVDLVVYSRCPRKWAAVDLETADIWMPNEKDKYRCYRITKEELKTLKMAILLAERRQRYRPA